MGRLSIKDLNDFVTPSQQCIKPVESPPITKDQETLVIYEEETGKYYEEYQEQKTYLSPASITLNDCLACSGCITSAESVLITQQNLDEVINILQHPEGRTIVFSISPQTKASIAVNKQSNIVQMTGELSNYLKSNGVSLVLDTCLGRDINLLLAAKEFVSRYKNGILPVITSSCPGWICYAEKVHPFILDKISKVKSPQQIMGTIVKQYVSKLLNIDSNEIYHVTVMPCYDKKLEASREDFVTNGVRDVDCVLSTLELEQLISSKFQNPQTNARISLDRFESLELYGLGDNGSDGALEFILKYASRELYGIEIGQDLEKFRITKTKDFQEYSVRDNNGNRIFCMVSAYGFKNIQNIIRRMKNQKIEYDYIEIMACPSGCLNGGGQSISKSKQFNEALNIYTALPYRSPEDNRIAHEMIEEFMEEQDGLIKFHTEYHVVPQTFSRIQSNW
jgi:iron only hydrogenase large subunit-like protein